MTVPPQSNYLAVIKVLGVGGGGVNAVNRMIEAGLRNVEFIAANTDAQALLMSDADLKLDIGRQLTRGLGAGSDPRWAARPPRSTAARSKRRSRALTWSSSPPARAEAPAPAPHRSWPRSQRASGPSPSGRDPALHLRGRRRAMQAEKGIQILKEKVDTLIVIPNDRLLTVSNDKTSMVNAFKIADEVLLQGVRGITDLITVPGLINTDFADVKMVMTNAGTAIMGIGSATGEGRAVNAARAAITSPLLEASIEGARGILLNIAGGTDLGLFEVNEAAEIIHSVAHPTPTSSSGRSSTTTWATRCASRSSPRASSAGKRADGRHRPARRRPAQQQRQCGRLTRLGARVHRRHLRRRRGRGARPRRRRVRRPLLPPLSPPGAGAPPIDPPWWGFASPRYASASRRRA